MAQRYLSNQPYSDKQSRTRGAKNQVMHKRAARVQGACPFTASIRVDRVRCRNERLLKANPQHDGGDADGIQSKLTGSGQPPDEDGCREPCAADDHLIQQR